MLREQGHEVEDLGTNGSASVDYPDFAHASPKRIAQGAAERGLLVCGTGVGMAIAANRHTGVRAVNPSDVFTAKMSRGHNDANVLCLGRASSARASRAKSSRPGSPLPTRAVATPVGSPRSRRRAVRA